MKEETFDGGGGFQIFFRSWRPATKPRGVVVLVHGFNAHSGYFTWVAEELVAEGFAVYAHDHRGRGRSAGERLYIEDISQYVDDVATFVNLAKSREPGLPVFVLGHSAGGVIASVYALDHQAEIDGLISESFAFQVFAPDFALTAIKGLARLAPRAHVLKLKNEDFSRNPEAVNTMDTDPLVAGENQPSRTVAAMVRGSERLRREFPRITLPVLIMHGTADHATRPGGSKLFFEKAGSADKTLKLYEGHFHDLLNDVDRDLVLADIKDWIEARIPKEKATEPLEQRADQ